VDEKDYLRLADTTFKTLFDAFDDIDPEDVDIDSAGDVITLSFKSGKRCVINTQRPVRQIWLAGGSRAWHFSWDGTRWLDDKGSGDELFTTLASIVSAESGITPHFSAS
jgi:CyaY protein